MKKILLILGLFLLAINFAQAQAQTINKTKTVEATTTKTQEFVEKAEYKEKISELEIEMKILKKERVNNSDKIKEFEIGKPYLDKHIETALDNKDNWLTTISIIATVLAFIPLIFAIFGYFKFKEVKEKAKEINEELEEITKVMMEARGYLEEVKKKEQEIKAISKFNECFIILNNKNLNKIEGIDKALECLKEAIEFKKDFHEAYGKKASLLMAKKDYIPALESINFAIDYINTNSTLCNFYLQIKADILCSLKKYSNALNILNDLINNKGIKNEFVLNTRGVCFLYLAIDNIELYNKALEDFNHSINFNIKFHPPYYNMAELHLASSEHKNYSESLSLYKKAWILAKSNKEDSIYDSSQEDLEKVITPKLKSEAEGKDKETLKQIKQLFEEEIRKREGEK